MLRLVFAAWAVVAALCGFLLYLQQEDLRVESPEESTCYRGPSRAVYGFFECRRPLKDPSTWG